MKAALEPWVYGNPPVTKVRRKRLGCGHGRGQGIVARDLRTAWCWACQKRVKMVKFPRPWKRLTRRR